MPTADTRDTRLPRIVGAACLIGVLLLIIRVNSPEASAGKEQLFDALTANTWCDKSAEYNKSLLPRTRRRYTFRKDGAYEWMHASDAIEGEGAGVWNMQQTTDNGGILLLDSGDMWRFTIPQDNLLALEALTLDACESLVYEGSQTSDALPEIASSPLVQRIAAHRWFKTDDFDLFRLPTTIIFRANGEYVAEFRYGECDYTGYWSLRDQKIIKEVPAEHCDSRNTGVTYFSGGSPVQFDGDTAVFAGAMYSKQEDMTRGIIWSDLGSRGMLEMRITYRKPIQYGAKNTLHVALKNGGSTDLTLQTFRVTEQQYQWGTDSFSAIEGKERTTLVSADLSSVALGAGEAHTFSLDVTFVERGDVQVRFMVDFSDHKRTYKRSQRGMLSL
jgi:hypothetical protein